MDTSFIRQCFREYGSMEHLTSVMYTTIDGKFVKIVEEVSIVEIKDGE
jgi:hypothetical protein